MREKLQVNASRCDIIHVYMGRGWYWGLIGNPLAHRVIAFGAHAAGLGFGAHGGWGLEIFGFWGLRVIEYGTQTLRNGTRVYRNGTQEYLYGTLALTISTPALWNGTRTALRNIYMALRNGTLALWHSNGTQEMSNMVSGRIEPLHVSKRLA